MKRVSSIGIAVFAALLLMGTTTSCNKYEDGPKFSLKSKTKRLSNKWYVSQSIATTGEDNTHEWENGSIEIKKDGSYSIVQFGPDQVMKVEETGTWEFVNKKTQIQTVGIQKEIEVATNTVYSEYSSDFLWRITKLEKDEVWIWRLSGANGLYEQLKLKPLE